MKVSNILDIEEKSLLFVIIIEVKQAVDEIAVDVMRQIEELKKKQADKIQETIHEISTAILGDRPLEPLNTPQRWPNDDVDKQVEWIKTEFAQMVKDINKEKESMERFEKELDRECEEIKEDMTRRGEKTASKFDIIQQRLLYMWKNGSFCQIMPQ